MWDAGKKGREDPARRDRSYCMTPLSREHHVIFSRRWDPHFLSALAKTARINARLFYCFYRGGGIEDGDEDGSRLGENDETGGLIRFGDCFGNGRNVRTDFVVAE